MTDDREEKPPVERPKFDYSLKIHVGVKPTEKPGDKPKGFAVAEIAGGKGDPEERKGG